MLDLGETLHELLIKKRELLSEITDLCKKEADAAKEDNWDEFNNSAEIFNSLIKKVDELDILLNEIIFKEETQSKRFEKLDAEIQSLVRECLGLQKQTADIIKQRQLQALGQLKMLDKKNDAFKAYGRTATYYRSVPKYVDNKK